MNTPEFSHKETNITPWVATDKAATPKFIAPEEKDTE